MAAPSHLTPKHLHKKYVKNTPYNSKVEQKDILLCNLTGLVKRGSYFKSNRMYLNTNVLKHLYDKRTAEEYDFIIDNFVKLVKYPNDIYKNRDGKTGTKCFTKRLGEFLYFISIEEKQDRNEIVTCFRIKPIREKKYLKHYKSIWNWESGISPS